MRKHATERNIIKQADKIASEKENLDVMSWRRIEQIADSLRADSVDDDRRKDYAREIIAIAHANLSLATKLGIEEDTNRMTASGMEVLEGGLIESDEKQPYQMPAWTGDGTLAEDAKDSLFFEGSGESADEVPIPRVEAPACEDGSADSETTSTAERIPEDEAEQPPSVEDENHSAEEDRPSVAVVVEPSTKPTEPDIMPPAPKWDNRFQVRKNRKEPPTAPAVQEQVEPEAS